MTISNYSVCNAETIKRAARALFVSMTKPSIFNAFIDAPNCDGARRVLEQLNGEIAHRGWCAMTEMQFKVLRPFINQTQWQSHFEWSANLRFQHIAGSMFVQFDNDLRRAIDDAAVKHVAKELTK